MAQPAPVSMVGSQFTSTSSCGARRTCVLCQDLEEIGRGCEPRLGDTGWQPGLQPASPAPVRPVVPLGLPGNRVTVATLCGPRQSVRRT